MSLRDDLMRHLSYNQKTGVFRWKIARPHRPIGSIAGAYLSSRHRRICFNYKMYRCARLAWLFMTGSWPKNEIDHINGIRDDDRWTNLRDVTRAENCQNIHKTNGICRLLGVCERAGRFRAQITINYVHHNIGTFDTPEQARRAYLKAKRSLHPAAIFTPSPKPSSR
jgi:hypothetical protein